jgi:hypothetical protein
VYSIDAYKVGYVAVQGRSPLTRPTSARCRRGHHRNIGIQGNYRIRGQLLHHRLGEYSCVPGNHVARPDVAAKQVADQGYLAAFGQMAAISFGVIVFWIPMYYFGKKLRYTSAEWRVLKWATTWSDE